MSSPKPSLVVLYNHHGEDEYERLKEVDPATLEFEPVYPLDVATVTEEYAAIVKGLRRAGYRVRALNLEDELRRLESLLSGRRRPDAIFNLVEHFRDDPELEAAVAGLLDLHGMPYTGAPPFALQLCQRKGLAKQLLLANGVPTPRFRSLSEARLPKRHGLRYPLIVKPGREDASSGVERESVVYDYPQLLARLEAVFAEFAAPVLVEEFIEGRELHVAILGNSPPQVLPISEWDFSELPPDYPPIISYAVKWDPLDEAYHRVHSLCPAALSRAALKRVEAAALRAYQLTGCRDYARLDIRLAKGNRPFVLEVNPNPDLTEGVSFMESAEAFGLSFEETLGRLAGFALARRRPLTPAA